MPRAFAPWVWTFPPFYCLAARREKEEENSAGHVAVGDFDAVAFVGEASFDFFCDEDAAVLAAGAAEGDGEVALALVDVMGQEEEEQLSGFVELIEAPM